MERSSATVDWWEASRTASCASPAALQHGRDPPMAEVEGGPGPHPLPLGQSRRGAEMPPSGQHELSRWNPSRVRNQSRLLSLNCPGLSGTLWPSSLQLIWLFSGPGEQFSGILEVGTCRALPSACTDPRPRSTAARRPLPLHFSLSAGHRYDFGTAPCRFHCQPSTTTSARH